jgi:hypothetical protein
VFHLSRQLSSVIQTESSKYRSWPGHEKDPVTNVANLLDPLKKQRFLRGSRSFGTLVTGSCSDIPVFRCCWPSDRCFLTAPGANFIPVRMWSKANYKIATAIFFELPLGCHSGAVRVLLANIDLGLDLVTCLRIVALGIMARGRGVPALRGDRQTH